MSTLTVVPLQEATNGPCACCNLTTHNLRGEILCDGKHRAVYYVRWTAERLDGHAEWLLDIGDGRDVPSTERRIVALRCRSYRRWPSFMVIDATRTSWGPQVAEGGRPMAATEVVGQAIATEAYAMVDEVLAHDPRVTAQFQAMAAAEPSRWRRWISDRWRSHLRARRHASASAQC